MNNKREERLVMLRSILADETAPILDRELAARRIIALTATATETPDTQAEITTDSGSGQRPMTEDERKVAELKRLFDQASKAEREQSAP